MEHLLQVMLDLLPSQPLRVYRTTPDNVSSLFSLELVVYLSLSLSLPLFPPSQKALVTHYSILEFPSLIIETRKDDYIVIPG